MTFIRWFMRMMWNFICLWSFVASIRPFKISKIWKTRYQNACNWDSFGGYFIICDRLLWELKLFLFHWIEMKLAHKITVCASGLEIKLTLSYQNPAKISNFEIPQLRWARSPIHTTIFEITRLTSLSYLSIKSCPSSCIDDSDKPPSKNRHEVTKTRLIYRLQSLVHSSAKLLGVSR